MRSLIMKALALIGFVLAVGAPTADANRIYLDFDDDDDPWTVRSVAPQGMTKAKVRWILEVSGEPLSGVPFEFWVYEACCEAGLDGVSQYGTRGNWWSRCKFDPELVEVWEINSFACTCCVPWYVDGMFIGDFVPGFRYFIGTTEWEATCSRPPCFPGTEVQVDILIGGVESETQLAFACAPTIEVALDVQPQVCPNLVDDGPYSASTVPIGVLGSGSFDARDIDPSTVVLYTPEHRSIFTTTARPTSSDINDLATPVSGSVPCECITDGPDGSADLILHFGRRQIGWVLGSPAWDGVRTLGVAGLLLDGAPFIATDCVGSEDEPRAATESLAYSLVPTMQPADPNPVRTSTSMSFLVPKRMPVRVSIFDASGRAIQELVRGEQSAGMHEVTWEAKDVAPGVYFYRFQAGSVDESRRLVVLK